MAAGTGSRFAGLRSLPSSALRVLGLGIGFVVLVTSIFAGVGALQDREPRPDEPIAAPEPTPVPPPAPAPEPDGDVNDPDADDTDTDDGAEDDAADDVPVEPPAPTGPRPESVTVQLLDAITGQDADAVARVRRILADANFNIRASNRARMMYDVTTVFYTDGFEAQGRLVAQALDVTEVRAMSTLPAERRLSSSIMVHVLVGADRR